MPALFRAVALLGKSTDDRVASCMLNLASHLSARGLSVWVNTDVRLAFPTSTVTACEEGEFTHRADLLIAIGGDGTLLRAAHLLAGRPIPLLGVNHGRLGFLTDISPSSMLEDIDRILEGHYIEDPRALLEARLLRGEVQIARQLALNDVVVQKAGTGRILDLQTSIDGRFVNAHRGDGLVIATATGSTAYALSCGGPIVVPNLDVWVLAPICPHTLSDRPLVVGADSAIEVVLDAQSGEAQVSCDGQMLGGVTHEDRLRVCKSDTRVTLLHSPDYDYYRLLRSKLHWGRGSSSNPHQKP